MAEPGDPSDRSLLARLRAGSQEAAVLLYSRYSRRLRELAAAQCSADLARKVEADDIVQSVFGSFFRGANQGFYELPDGEELWRLFLVIALNKIRERSRFHRAAKRDLRRTVAGEAFELTMESVAARDEAAAAMLEVTVSDVLEKMSPTHCAVIRLRIEGHEVGEIAERIGRSKRSTERFLQEARQQLALHLAPDEPPT